MSAPGMQREAVAQETEDGGSLLASLLAKPTTLGKAKAKAKAKAAIPLDFSIAMSTLVNAQEQFYRRSFSNPPPQADCYVCGGKDPGCPVYRGGLR